MVVNINYRFLFGSAFFLMLYKNIRSRLFPCSFFDAH